MIVQHKIDDVTFIESIFQRNELNEPFHEILYVQNIRCISGHVGSISPTGQSLSLLVTLLNLYSGPQKSWSFLHKKYVWKQGSWLLRPTVPTVQARAIILTPSSYSMRKKPIHTPDLDVRHLISTVQNHVFSLTTVSTFFLNIEPDKKDSLRCGGQLSQVVLSGYGLFGKF